MATSLWEHFWVLPDPRVERTRKHKLEDILTITICAVICGAETWTDIAAFGETKESWFRTFLELPHGIPSHDTFGRVLAALDPDAFERSFHAWVTDLAGTSAGKHVAIDGKAIRRSLDRASGKACIHLVSAWVCEDHAVFGQVAVDDKSNEITAIPKLLEMLALREATVTIDAIGCQKAIARQIRAQGSHYVLAVKGNQGALHDDVTLFMDDALTRDFAGMDHDFWEQTQKGHGRIETRRVWCTEEVQWLRRRQPQWAGLADGGFSVRRALSQNQPLKDIVARRPGGYHRRVRRNTLCRQTKGTKIGGPAHRTPKTAFRTPRGKVELRELLTVVVSRESSRNVGESISRHARGMLIGSYLAGSSETRHERGEFGCCPRGTV